MKNQTSGCLKGLFTLVAACLILSALPVRAQEPSDASLPSPESLIERHLEAIGGKAALAKVATRVSTGTLEIKPMGVTGTFVNYQARPARIYTRLELDGLGTIERGFDGEVFWERTGQAGVRVMKGEERALMLVLTRMDLSDYVSLFQTMKTIGPATVGDEACMKAMLTPKDVENPIVLDFSLATGRIVRMVTTLPAKNGAITVENLISEYKEIDEVLVPRLAVEKALNIETRITLTEIRQNVELDGKIFRLPGADNGKNAGYETGK